MKKVLSKEARQLEAAHWMSLKKVLAGQTVKACRK